LAHVPLLHNLANQLASRAFDEFRLVSWAFQVDSRLGVGVYRWRFGRILYCGWNNLDLVSGPSFLQDRHFRLSDNARKQEC
jgi:hypothetical protein